MPIHKKKRPETERAPIATSIDACSFRDAIAPWAAALHAGDGKLHYAGAAVDPGAR